MNITKQYYLPRYQIILLCALFFVLTQNIVFWQEVFQRLSFNSVNDLVFIVSLFIVLFCGIAILFSLLFWRYTTTLVFFILTLLSTVFNYYSIRYHLFMDREMLINIFETNTLEVFDLLNIKLFLWIAFGCVIPTLVVGKLSVKPSPCFKQIAQRMGLILGAAVIIGGVAMGSYKEYASFFRNNRTIVKLIMPVSYVTGYVSYVRKQYTQHMPFLYIAEDAKLIKPKTQKKSIFIMVVGETARSMNFSLNGYEKETNPYLSKVDNVLSFRDVASCGTATAISVPCMFSLLTQDSFSKIKAENQENLTDILQKSGYKLLWRENDNGCKGVCNRIPTENVGDYVHAKTTTSNFYFDEYLLENLDQYIKSYENSDENLVIFLHMNGSHGPTYFQRYPKEMRTFSPSCETNHIENCDRTSLVNTYDNTIVYTDYVLNKTISLLKTFDDQYETAMLYISDHGESLGESGFYLHGAPYPIAPVEQRTVPMIFWADNEFYQNRNINLACMQKRTVSSGYSQDNIFHTILGLLYVDTKVYDPKLDIFKDC